MSNVLQDRIAEIKRRGDLNRSRWNPEDMPALSGWPLRVYRWWQEETGCYGRDNLCHFLRVVLIWAPLRWVTKPVRAVMKPLRRIFGSALVPIFMALLAVMVIGNEALWVARHGLVPVLRGNAILLAIIVAGWGIVRLVRRYKRQLGDALSWFVDARPARLPWLRPWLVVPAAAIVLAWFSEFMRSLVIIAAFIGILFGMMALIFWSSGKLETWMRLRNARAAKENFLRELFGALYPGKAGDEQAYAAWRERYIQWRIAQFQRKWSTVHIHSYDDITYTMLTGGIGNIPYGSYIVHDKVERAIIARETERAERPKRPSRVRGALVAVGQFFQLIWAFIVIKKWKICPIIQLDEPAR